jgi:hypothetical protein
VAAHLPPGERLRLLDVGAGAGLVGRYLAAERPRAEYFFIEPIPSLRARLVAHHGAEHDLGNAACYDAMDVITLLDVLEHQADDVAFLRDLVGRCRSGCTVIVTVPALAGLWSEWDTALGHHRRYSRAALRATLEGAGLVVRRERFLFPELLPLALVRRWQGGAAPTDTDVEFPDLPRALNATLYAIGRASQLLGDTTPLGTSLFAVATRP